MYNLPKFRENQITPIYNITVYILIQMDQFSAIIKFEILAYG